MYHLYNLYYFPAEDDEIGKQLVVDVFEGGEGTDCGIPTHQLEALR